jgi:hypothetical protein
MIHNKKGREPCEGIYWKTSNNKNKSDIEEVKESGIRIVSKEEKEAWIKALTQANVEVFKEKVQMDLRKYFDNILEINEDADTCKKIKIDINIEIML